MAKRLKHIGREIYIISDSNGWVKIGISSNPHKRLAGLQIANPHKLKLFVAIPTPRADLIESDVHLRLGKAKRCGEWFSVSETEALLAVTRALSAKYEKTRESVWEYKPRRKLPPFSKIARYGDRAYAGLY